MPLAIGFKRLVTNEHPPLIPLSGSLLLEFTKFIALQVANHVLGSVLCCPGCFSVYRAKALRDVLPLYATTADHAVDFLTKDMGKTITRTQAQMQR